MDFVKLAVSLGRFFHGKVDRCSPPRCETFDVPSAMFFELFGPIKSQESLVDGHWWAKRHKKGICLVFDTSSSYVLI